jgi:hypothetical protein
MSMRVTDAKQVLSVILPIDGYTNVRVGSERASGHSVKKSFHTQHNLIQATLAGPERGLYAAWTDVGI